MLLQGSCPAGTILTPQGEPDEIQPVWSPVVLPRPHRDTELTQAQIVRLQSSGLHRAAYKSTTVV